MTSNNSKHVRKSPLPQGLYLEDLHDGAEVEVRTRNTQYRFEYLGGGLVMISGHPEYCPAPTPARVNGSTWGGSAIKVGFLGHGMHLEYQHPDWGPIVTSPIVDISCLPEPDRFPRRCRRPAAFDRN